MIMVVWDGAGAGAGAGVESIECVGGVSGVVKCLILGLWTDGCTSRVAISYCYCNRKGVFNYIYVKQHL